MNRLQNSRYRRHDPDRARQRLRNGWLNDYVGSMAKRTIGLNSLTVSVGMPNLHDARKNKQGTAEEAERHPQPMSYFWIEAAAEHPCDYNLQGL
jgi:hypothetical protein